MKLSRDFSEFLASLDAESVRYLLVGGYALAAHGIPRFTKDIDILSGISGVEFESSWKRRIEVIWMDARFP